MAAQRATRTWGRLLLVILAFGMVGCNRHLDATRTSHLVYDRDRDEFSHIRVFHDIHVVRRSSTIDGKPGTARTRREIDEDFDYLVALWKNRNDLIMTPSIVDFSESQYLYIGPREYREIDLEQRLDEKEIKKSLIDLSKIHIRPGEFFASPKGSLCYYHGCYIPGTTIDELLKSQLDVLNDGVMESLLEGQQKRKDRKKARPTWDDLRRQLLPEKKDSSNKAKDTSDKSVEPWDVLDDESIRLLIHQASGREISIVRDREHFVLRFKVSAPDAVELEKTKRTWDVTVKASRAKGESIDPLAVMLENGLELKTSPSGNVTVTLNILAIFPAHLPKELGNDARESKKTAETVEEAKTRAVFEREAREDLATAEARGIPVNRTITYEKVLADFAKGRKK